MPINKAWHLEHKMPKNPTEAECLRWHLSHVKHCTCWPLPKSLTSKIKKCSRGHYYLSSGPCPKCWPGYKKHKTPKKR
ncbi:MAG TPA: hypothetical protein DDW92_02150 [Candidatus Veblenbacteria bacterium]|nr:hypothetical protein [Candidatus Veblenbacteria bacterium]HBH17040.1 hypothetical protein [Candidatus Veblenbacteria bacterium]HBT92642.1 hypothetical protein [Candidatus Veblenbacteria bacterium]HBZ36622.1 hypothetical protein [Candidatus Veblenbacteria bacterium]HCM45758.1 hypothetical protein [Candidatus Veblenbacteria bacterium]